MVSRILPECFENMLFFSQKDFRSFTKLSRITEEDPKISLHSGKLYFVSSKKDYYYICYPPLQALKAIAVLDGISHC